MKRFILSVMVIFALAMPAFSADYVSGDVLVVLRPSEGEIQSSAFRASAFAASAGAELRQVYSALSENSGEVYALIHADNQSADILAQKLLDSPEVLAASPNYKIRAALSPNDSYMDKLWGMRYIKAPDAWDITTGSRSVYVAIIDSGIDDTNPDLTANVATEYSKNTYDSNSSSARDDFGHGTHVAGIIGAVGNNGEGVAGVCWNVGLISVKALGSDGTGNFATVIYALNYVASLLKQGVNICAVNMSLETYIPAAPTHDNVVRMPLWRAFKAIDELNKAVIVVAAGNYSQTVGEPTNKTEKGVFAPSEYVYPASFTGLDNMLSVSALNSKGQIADFSNIGASIAAPGEDILSTWLQSSWLHTLFSDISTSTQKGTSMAAPHVSGALAMLASQRPGSTAYQLRQTLLDGNGIAGKKDGVFGLRAALDYQSTHTYTETQNSGGSTEKENDDKNEENTSSSENTSTNTNTNTNTNSNNYIPQEDPNGNSYSDYKEYTPTNEAYGQKQDNSGGGSGCSGITLHFFMLFALVPVISLAKIH